MDLTHYPGWEELIASLNLKGIRMLVYLNPMLVNISMRGTPFIHNYYVEAIEHGYAVRNPDGSLWSGYNDAIMVDLTNPNALEWMKQIIAKVNRFMHNRANCINTNSVLLCLTKYPTS